MIVIIVLILILPAWILLSVAIGATFALVIKRPMTISISAPAQELSPEDPRCVFCNASYPTDGRDEKWVCLTSSSRPSVYACCNEHLERYFMQGDQ